MTKESKKEIFKAAFGLSSAYAMWKEVGNEFEFGDELSHDIIGPVRWFGRLGIKITVSVLTYIFAEAVIEQGYSAVANTITKPNDEDLEETDSVNDISEKETVEEDE